MVKIIKGGRRLLKQTELNDRLSKKKGSISGEIANVFVDQRLVRQNYTDIASRNAGDANIPLGQIVRVGTKWYQKIITSGPVNDRYEYISDSDSKNVEQISGAGFDASVITDDNIARIIHNIGTTDQNITNVTVNEKGEAITTYEIKAGKKAMVYKLGTTMVVGPFGGDSLIPKDLKTDNAALEPGHYIVDSTVGPIAVTLTDEPGKWSFSDAYGNTDVNNLSISLPTTKNFKVGKNPITIGPLILDVTQDDVYILRSETTPGIYAVSDEQKIVVPNVLNARGGWDADADTFTQTGITGTMATPTNRVENNTNYVYLITKTGDKDLGQGTTTFEKDGTITWFDATTYRYDAPNSKGFIQDVFANRPIPTVLNVGTIFFATDTGAKSISTGLDWSRFTNFRQFGNMTTATAATIGGEEFVVVGAGDNYVGTWRNHTGTPTQFSTTGANFTKIAEPSAGGNVVGASDTYAGLPTTRPDGTALKLHDVARLTKKDGTNAPGRYKVIALATTAPVAPAQWSLVFETPEVELKEFTVRSDENIAADPQGYGISLTNSFIDQATTAKAIAYDGTITAQGIGTTANPNVASMRFSHANDAYLHTIVLDRSTIDTTNFIEFGLEITGGDSSGNHVIRFDRDGVQQTLATPTSGSYTTNITTSVDATADTLKIEFKSNMLGGGQVRINLLNTQTNPMTFVYATKQATRDRRILDAAFQFSGSERVSNTGHSDFSVKFDITKCKYIDLTFSDNPRATAAGQFSFTRRVEVKTFIISDREILPRYSNQYIWLRKNSVGGLEQGNLQGRMYDGGDVYLLEAVGYIETNI